MREVQACGSALFSFGCIVLMLVALAVVIWLFTHG